MRTYFKPIFTSKLSSKSRFLLPLVAACAAVPLRADSVTWVDGSSNWSIGSNWSSGNPPAPEDSVFLTQSDSINRTVSLDVASTLAGLTIDSTGSGLMTLSQASNTFLAFAASNQLIGLGGSGDYVQTFGTNSGNALYLGYATGSTGYYTMNTVFSAFLTMNESESIGLSGSGTVTQSGNGTRNSSAALYLGENANGVGHYTLNSGVFIVSGTALIGNAGFGTFNQANGTFTIGDDLRIGNLPGSVGIYNLAGGTASASNIYLGSQGGSASLTISGGQLTTPGTVELDSISSSAFLSGGTLTAATLNIAANPSGFAWSGGTLAITGPVGFATSTLGDLTLTSTKQLAVTNRLDMTSGHVTLTAGTLTAGSIDTTGNPTGFIWIDGTIAVTGAAGFTPSANNLGTTIRLSDQKNLAVTNALTLPAGTSLIMSSGTLSAGSLDTTGNSGGFNWGGGTLAITGPAGLTLSATNIGTSVSVRSSRQLVVTKSLTLPAGASLRLQGGTISAGILDTSANPAGFSWTSGTLAITGGAGLTPSAGNLGPAINLVPGQILSVSNTLSLPDGTSLHLSGGTASATSLVTSGGDLAIAAGALSTTGNEYLGSAAPVVVSHTGGTNQVGGNLYLAVGSGASGTYNLSDGATLLVQGNEYIGSAASATFNQSGGMHSLSGTGQVGTLQVGGSTGTVGTYNLSGGTLSVANREVIGGTGLGQFLQTGGTNTAATILIGGTALNGTTQISTYTLTGGTINAGLMGLNNDGEGFLAVHGGQLFAGGLTLTSGTGTGMVFDGGLVSVGGFESSATDYIPNTFTWTAGTLAVTGSTGLIISASSVGKTIDVSGSKTLTVKKTLTVPTGSSLTVSGGSVSAGTFQTSFDQDLRSPGTFTQTQGQTIISGKTTNGGTFNQSGGFFQTSSLVNNGSFTASSAILGAVTGTGTMSVLAGPGVTAGPITQNQRGASDRIDLTVNGRLNIVPQTGLSTVFAISVGASGLLDLADNPLVVNYPGASPQGSIRQWIGSAYAGGTWTGGSGITSSAAESDPAAVGAIGYAEASNLLAAGIGNFHGDMLAPFPFQVLLAYTSYGDTNLDGNVDGVDFQRFLAGLASGGSTWAQGDFNYDGRVDLGNDLPLFLRGYLSRGNSPNDLVAIVNGNPQLSGTQRAQILSLVPEPSCVGATLLAGIGFSARRRRRR